MDFFLVSFCFVEPNLRNESLKVATIRFSDFLEGATKKAEKISLKKILIGRNSPVDSNDLFVITRRVTR